MFSVIFWEMIHLDIELNEMDVTDDHHIFIWDNLRAHHAAYVQDIVTSRAGQWRFSIVPRP